MKKVVLFDFSPDELEKIESQNGSLERQDEEDKLMHSVLDGNKEEVMDGKLVEEAVNQGVGIFNPDVLFENIVKNYKMALQFYGESLIRQLTGYDPNTVEQNKGIPEFQRAVSSNIKSKIEDLKKKNVLNKDGTIADYGYRLSALPLLMYELDRILPKGIQGEKVSKKIYAYGERGNTRDYRKGDKYHDIEFKASVKRAIRRFHKKMTKQDLKVSERLARGKTYIIYALDASGSMKGQKIAACKRAGVALAYQALSNKDKVGLIVFGSDIIKEVPPTENFVELISAIIKIRASKETNFIASISKAIELFPNENITKHLIIISDAVPTVGNDPEKDTYEAVDVANANGITVSMIGIQLDAKGEKVGKKIVEHGKGRFYVVNDVENLDMVILQEYGALKEE